MSFCKRKTHPWSDTSWRRQFLWIRGTFCGLFFTHLPFLRFLPQTGVGPTQFRSPFLALACTGDAAPSPSGALPGAKPVSTSRSGNQARQRPARGSPWAFSMAAAPTENSKEKEASQWVGAEAALRPPWPPADTCIRSPPSGASAQLPTTRHFRVYLAGWRAEGLGQIHP